MGWADWVRPSVVKALCGKKLGAAKPPQGINDNEIIVFKEKVEMM